MERVEGDNSTDDTGTAIELKAGKIFSNNFGVEAKITKTITPAKVDVPAGIGYYYPDTEVEFLTYSIWGMYHHKLTQEITISPKIGFLKEDVDIDVEEKTNRDDSGIAFGIDIRKSFPNSGFDIYAGYTIVEKHIDHLSFGIQKIF